MLNPFHQVELLHDMLFWVWNNQEYYWLPARHFVRCSQESCCCHFHLGSRQGKDQLYIFRYLQLWLPYSILAPFPYFLYTQGKDVKYICPAPVFHQTPPLAHALFWCHLVGDRESSKSFYLLSACCELSIYISNFKFSYDPALNPFL